MVLLACWEGFSVGSAALDKYVGPQAKNNNNNYSAWMILLFNIKLNEMADLLNYFPNCLSNFKMHEKFNTNSKNDLNVVCSVSA